MENYKIREIRLGKLGTGYYCEFKHNGKEYYATLMEVLRDEYDFVNDPLTIDIDLKTDIIYEFSVYTGDECRRVFITEANIYEIDKKSMIEYIEKFKGRVPMSEYKIIRDKHGDGIGAKFSYNGENYYADLRVVNDFKTKKYVNECVINYDLKEGFSLEVLYCKRNIPISEDALVECIEEFKAGKKGEYKPTIEDMLLVN